MTVSIAAECVPNDAPGLEKAAANRVKSNPAKDRGRGGQPFGSVAQRTAALANGNRKRLEQAAVKRALKNRELTLGEALTNEAASGIRIAALMECVPYLTPDRVSTILLIARIGYARRVGRLRDIDRWKLMHLMAERHPGIKVKP